MQWYSTRYVTSGHRKETQVVGANADHCTATSLAGRVCSFGTLSLTCHNSASQKGGGKPFPMLWCAEPLVRGEFCATFSPGLTRCIHLGKVKRSVAVADVYSYPGFAVESSSLIAMLLAWKYISPPSCMPRFVNGGEIKKYS